MPIGTTQNVKRYGRYYRRKVRVGGRPYMVRRLGMYKGLQVRRRIGNPTPTFVETYSKSSVTAGGGVFSARITDIPQIAQYATLYKQYRINWIKVMLIPDFNSAAADQNADQYNATIPTGNVGMGRIAWAINDSPQLANPATEASVLQDNGAKVRAVGTKWQASFKPCSDTGVTSGTTGTAIWARQKFKQFFNFDLVTTGNNPLHYGISYFITHPANGLTPLYNVYFKVSFTLRDPQ